MTPTSGLSCMRFGGGTRTPCPAFREWLGCVLCCWMCVATIASSVLCFEDPPRHVLSAYLRHGFYAEATFSAAGIVSVGILLKT